MYNNSKIAKAVRLAMMFGAVGSLAISASAFSAEDAAENAAAEAEVERVEVTGSRISRADLSQPTPVITLTSKDIAEYGTPDLGTILADLPALSAEDTLVGNNGDNELAGISSANLRDLGAERTLVLVNGKRHVAAVAGSAQVDLSTIPTALIDRVEVITGGASAVYGSDAVTGVVNVIMKKDYEGLEFNFSGSTDTESIGAKNHSFSVVAGANIADGRGNVTFFAGVDKISEVLVTDLRQSNGWSTIVNPDDTGENDGVFDRLRVPNVYSEYIDENGVAFDANTFSPIVVFDNDGNPVQQTSRDGSNSFAFGNFPDGCDYCFNGEDYENVLPQIDKLTLASSFNFDISQNINFYGDFKYVSTDIKQQFQPAFRFFDEFIDVAENAYLDEGLRTSLLSAGTTGFFQNKFVSEIGNRSAENTRDLYRIVTGFQGEFSLSETDLNYDVYYVKGESNNTRYTQNDLIVGNYAAAIDAVIDPDTGEVACRSQVESAQGDGYEDSATVDAGSCVPYNSFGFNQASQAAKDWVSADTLRTDTITQQLFGGYIGFDTSEFFSLQGGAIGIAVGFEYREETSASTTDSLTQSGVLAGAATPNEFGQFDVTEQFIEISLPILADVAFAKELTIDAAYRSADYSHTGKADAWKVGFMYAPIESLRLRGTFGEAVRAPNIAEAFGAQSPGFARVADPCDVDNINDDPDRTANCAALGIPAGFSANDNVSVDLISGGNPNLFSESSESLTVGFVWEPSFVENLYFSVDYYDIDIEDAIIDVTAQNISDNCVDATGGPDDNFCAQVDRDPITHDISLVRSGFINASALNTKGVEIQMSYDTDLSMFSLPGSLRFNVLVNNLLEYNIFEFQDRPDELNVEEGEIGNPKLQGRLSTTYILDDLIVSWKVRYTDRVVTYDVSPIDGGSPEDLSHGYVPSQVIHDLTSSYQLNDNISFGFGVRNLFDNLPPAFVTTAETNDSSSAGYDVIGRRVFGNVKVTF